MTRVLVSVCTLLLSAAACTSGRNAGPGGLAPLAAVLPLPNPALPPWIVQISPTNRAAEDAQIRVRFSRDIVKVEDLAGGDRSAALQAFSLEPSVPGRFVIYTPRLIAYETDAALPAATRFRVTLHAGLHDLANDRLDHDLAWTFETTPLSVSGLPAQESEAQPPVVGLNPQIGVGTNVQVDAASLADRTEFVPDGNKDASSVGVTAVAATPSPSPSPQEASDAAGERTPAAFTYVLAPRTQLAPGTSYRIVVHAGVAPAGGNLPSMSEFTGRVRARGPLAFTRVEPYERPFDTGGSGRFQGGAPQLDFTNPLDADSARAAVHVSPAPQPLVVDANDGDTWLRVASSGLKPRTRYTITVDASLRDTFGQTLGTPQTATFDTGALAADLWAPAGLNVFPADRNLQLRVYATNLPDHAFNAGFRSVRPIELVDAVDASPASNGQPSLGPPSSTWRSMPVPHSAGPTAISAIPLRREIGGATGMLAYGVSARTNQYRDDTGKVTWARPEFYGTVQLTNLGVFAQWFPHGGVVRVNRLSDGTPVAGAAIDVYESRLDSQAFPNASRPPAARCAFGRTDTTGSWRLDGVAFAPCAATSTSATDAPTLLVVARDARDWASVRTFSWSGGYDDGLNGGWSAGQPEARGVIASDRSLYQPGETAYFSGLAYFVTDGVLRRGRAASYALTLQSPSGTKRSIGNARPDEFGAFSIRLPLTREQELGDYTVHAAAPNGEAFDGTFRVAEFKPPNFRVALTLDRATTAVGGTIHATARSEYLFGAPVAGAQSRLSVTRERSYFTPPGWDSWEFGRVWPYPEEEPSVSADVLQKDMTVGASGDVAFDVGVGRDLPYPMTYRVDLQTTDVANVAVSDAKTFTALPSPDLIALSGDFVGRSQTPFTVKAAVLDAGGKPLTGRQLHLVLQRRTFARATRIVEGGLTPSQSAEYTTVDQRDVTSAAQPQDVTLTPRDPGEYRVRANVAGAATDATATDHIVWVSGPGAADWSTADSRLQIKLDKTSYRPGDIASAVIASPYDEAQLDFAVIRAGVLYHQRTIVKGSAPRVHFRVDDAMQPNASVEALLVRRGAPLSKGVPRALDRLARIGFVAFTTSLDDKVLRVKVLPAGGSTAPGASQRVRVRLTDHLGKAVRGEVALMVVNDAVLQLTGYRPPDLIKAIYAEQSISTRYADSRSDVVLNSPARPVEKGYGFGGGFLAGAGSTRIRTNFKPVAYFNGALRTDANGDADASFTLPDDLTTWRAMALAFTRDARFGNGENTFLTTKPLIANPVAPQFGRPGDHLDGGVSVTNTAKSTGTLRITGTLSGGLAFATGAATSADASLDTAAGSGTSAYRFPMIVMTAQDALMQFKTTLGGNADAFAVPFLVRTSDVMESAVQTGSTRDRATVPLAVAATLPSDAGGLTVQIASTIVPDVAEPVRIAVADDSRFGWSVVGRLDVAANALLLARTYRQSARSDVQRAAADAVGVLGTLRSSDGGVAEWPNAASSDPFLDAAAYTALAHGRAASVAGVAPLLDRLGAALHRTLANPGMHRGYGNEPLRSEVRLATLAALAENGDVRSDFIGDIVARADKLTLAERFTLARLLTRLPDWRQRAADMTHRLQQQMAETGRSAAVVGTYGGVEEQAAALRLLVATRADTDLRDRALTSLLGLRVDGSWGCACSNALSMDALVAYASLEGTPPDFSGTVGIGTAQRRSFALSGYQKTQEEFTIPMGDVPRGSSDVVLQKTGSGTLRYAVSLRYRVADTAPGRYQGLRLDRVVRAAGTDRTLATFGLAATPTVSVKPAGVFEIEDRIITDHPVDRVTIVDPLPAGFEAVDTSFLTSSTAVRARTDNWEIAYQQIYHDRVEAFARHLNPGVYALHYLVRSVTPGTFAWPAGQVSLERAPEEFGRTSAGTLVIQ